MAQEAPVDVVVRVRPSIPAPIRESESPARRVRHLRLTEAAETISVVDDHLLHLSGHPKGTGAGSRRVQPRSFGFDRVFGPESTTSAVYDACLVPLIDNVMGGRNATIFAYGATGCGKSHTIFGSPTEQGLVDLAFEGIWHRIEKLKPMVETTVTVQYLQLYNENIQDLLTDSHRKLELRQGPGAQMVVRGLSEHFPSTVEEARSLVVEGNSRRTVAHTFANAVSSRSHAVLLIKVTMRQLEGGLECTSRQATLSIIDLAGSERAATTRNRGQQFVESAAINRSLLSLGNCIKYLSDPRTRAKHIPYRDSKLTRLLQYSLGGNCRTAMIVCVSPASQHWDETRNTLEYAYRAKSIRTVTRPNESSSRLLITEFKQRLEEQDAIITQLRIQLQNSQNNSDAMREQAREYFVAQMRTPEVARALAALDSAEWFEALLENLVAPRLTVSTPKRLPSSSPPSTKRTRLLF